jgi:hypothetical protein
MFKIYKIDNERIHVGYKPLRMTKALIIHENDLNELINSLLKFVSDNATKEVKG